MITLERDLEIATDFLREVVEQDSNIAASEVLSACRGAIAALDLTETYEEFRSVLVGFAEDDAKKAVN